VACIVTSGGGGVSSALVVASNKASDVALRNIDDRECLCERTRTPLRGVGLKACGMESRRQETREYPKRSKRRFGVTFFVQIICRRDYGVATTVGCNVIVLGKSATRKQPQFGLPRDLIGTLFRGLVSVVEGKAMSS
jgi:hypothetical protein